MRVGLAATHKSASLVGERVPLSSRVASASRNIGRRLEHRRSLGGKTSIDGGSGESEGEFISSELFLRDAIPPPNSAVVVVVKLLMNCRDGFKAWSRANLYKMQEKKKRNSMGAT